MVVVTLIKIGGGGCLLCLYYACEHTLMTRNRSKKYMVVLYIFYEKKYLLHKDVFRINAKYSNVTL